MKHIISRRTKLNIFFVAVKVVLCFCLLIGGTLTLFTDKEETNVRVTAGDMKMELFTVDIDGNETDISGKADNIFGTDDWEPGQTRVVFFKVRSLSNIDVKYTLELLVSSDELDGALEYCAYEGAPFEIDGQTWESLTHSHSVNLLVRGQNSISGNTYIEMSPSEEHYYTLFVHMREDAGDYQDKSVNIDVHLHATQGNAVIGQ